MFTVNTNRAIKMNRGDDVQFPLFINNGDRLNWNRYEFNLINNPTEDLEEVYFYILPLHESYENFILRKTFCANGTIKTYRCIDTEETEIYSQKTVNDNKDIVIRLWESDTSFICPGEYVYVVRAKVFTDKINSKNIITSGESLFTTLQVTNKYPFYLLDDDIIRAD